MEQTRFAYLKLSISYFKLILRTQIPSKELLNDMEMATNEHGELTVQRAVFIEYFDKKQRIIQLNVRCDPGNHMAPLFDVHVNYEGHLFKFKKDIVVNKKYITGPKDLGIEKKQLKKLINYYKKGKIKRVLIKIGIPFVPSFLIAYLITLWIGNVLLLFL